jgi:tetratricopeptide (TPR) repeat protein
MIADSLQFSWLDMDWLSDTTRALRRMETVLAKSDIEKLPWDQRPYLGLAIFYANAGEIQRAKALVARDSASIPNEGERRIRAPGHHAVRGYIARAEGRYDEAIREMWRADTTYDGPNGACGMCVYDDLGWTYDRAGQADSAIHYFELFMRTPFMGKQSFAAAGRATMHRRLGELYESKGDVRNAAEQYRQFISLWENADPQLQPQVAAVRRKLSRLSDVEKGGSR